MDTIELTDHGIAVFLITEYISWRKPPFNLRTCVILDISFESFVVRLGYKLTEERSLRNDLIYKTASRL